MGILSITIFDVAEKSGYSISTVSRVINNSKSVRPQTREAILKVIEEMGFVPNNIAQSLVNKTTKMVGIIVADINNPFYSEMVRGIEDEISKCGYSVIVCNSDENMDKEKHIIDVLLKKQVDGIIFTGGRGEGDEYNQHVEELSYKIPVVLSNECLENSNTYSVSCYKEKGAYDATNHLIKMGHRRIGFINGLENFRPSIEKLEGYKRALIANNIEFDSTIVYSSNYHIEGGAKGAEYLLNIENPPTAIFTANDLMATGAMKKIKYLGKSIPDDISLVGFDDVYLTEILDPSLTSVSQRIYEQGKEAAKIINSIFNHNKKIKKKIILNPVIVYRDSVKKIINNGESH